MNDPIEILVESDEDDEYLKMLTLIGRDEAMDIRIATHEVGHLLALGLRDWPVGSVTIQPTDTYEGCVTGPRYGAARAKDNEALASDICDVLSPTMPRDGEDRGAASDVFQNVLDQCIATMGAKPWNG